MKRREVIIPHIHIIDGLTEEERQATFDAQRTVVARHIVAQGKGPGDRNPGVGMSLADARAWLERVEGRPQ